MQRFSAKEVQELLSKKGIPISLRTIHYYVSELKLIEVSKSRKTFTEEDILKIEHIKLIQKYSNLSLKKIKELIKNKSLKEIETISLQLANKELLDINKVYSISNSIISQSNISLDSEQSNFNLTNSFNHVEEYISFNDKKLLPNEVTVNSKTCNEVKQNYQNNFLKITEEITLMYSKEISNKKLDKIIQFILNLD